MTDTRHIAGIYDLLLYIPSIDIRRRTVEIVQRLHPERIIDVCCGTGFQLKMLASLDCLAVGIDLSPGMVSAAKRGKISVPCSLQDAGNLAFRDETFSLSMITFGLHEKDRETAKRIVREMIRVTRRDGRILITDYEITGRTSRFSRGTISTIERIAGKEHHAYFRDYHDAGGMGPLLPAGRLEIEEEHWFASHGIVTRLFKRIDMK